MHPPPTIPPPPHLHRLPLFQPFPCMVGGGAEPRALQLARQRIRPRLVAAVHHAAAHRGQRTCIEQGGAKGEGRVGRTGFRVDGLGGGGGEWHTLKSGEFDILPLLTIFEHVCSHHTCLQQ